MEVESDLDRGTEDEGGFYRHVELNGTLQRASVVNVEHQVNSFDNNAVSDVILVALHFAVAREAFQQTFLQVLEANLRIEHGNRRAAQAEHAEGQKHRDGLEKLRRFVAGKVLDHNLLTYRAATIENEIVAEGEWLFLVEENSKRIEKEEEK